MLDLFDNYIRKQARVFKCICLMLWGELLFEKCDVLRVTLCLVLKKQQGVTRSLTIAGGSDLG